ncbi:hypothetical protein [Saccharopolyspora griseoalba]|uniref:Uncharacterized protein n=1 Tax=Saccharopolyspora griseoalba TaxID=1431848 RepID=A0ABW2LTQ5_9PSEU
MLWNVMIEGRPDLYRLEAPSENDLQRLIAEAWAAEHGLNVDAVQTVRQYDEEAGVGSGRCWYGGQITGVFVYCRGVRTALAATAA